MNDYLAGLVAGLMGFAADEIDRQAPLTRLGLDSLTAMRARGAVERDFGLPLPVPLLLRGASLTELAEHLAQNLAQQAGFGGESARPAERTVERGYVDQVIAPSQTRLQVARALRNSWPVLAGALGLPA